MKGNKIHAIELLYFDGCPSYPEALKNLKAVLATNRIDARITLIAVDSPGSAEVLQFHGSPSIRINGVDLEEKEGAFSYACRMYEVDGQQVGAPSPSFIQQRLREMKIVA